MRAGFHTKSPFELIEHHEYQGEGWRVTVHPRGRMVTYSTTDARAMFGEDDRREFTDARDYVNHPGDIAIFARLHLALGERLDSDRFTLNSQQAHDLIGPIS